MVGPTGRQSVGRAGPWARHEQMTGRPEQSYMTARPVLERHACSVITVPHRIASKQIDISTQQSVTGFGREEHKPASRHTAMQQTSKCGAPKRPPAARGMQGNPPEGGLYDS